jgi:hypothetical protein
MVAVLITLLITSALLAAAFAAASGDIKLTSTNLNSKNAYNAAVAGIDAFQHHLDVAPNYWTECKTASNVSVPGSINETYSYQIVPATKTSYSSCSTTSPSASVIESSGKASGTLRLVSTGKAGNETRSVVATFTHVGFLNYVYYTNYEDLDPSFYNGGKQCEAYHAERVKNGVQTKPCVEIEFITGDEIKGPVHTNDAALVCGTPSFGREGESPKDAVEINGETYSEGGGCSDSPKFNGEYITKGKVILPPETDGELATLAKPEYTFSGKTLVTLNANLSESSPENTITVANANLNAGAPTTLKWPENGVLYVNESSTTGCSYNYKPYDSIYTEDSGCGNVYVQGNYTKSLTIASANNVIIDGNIQTKTESSGAPSGGATLGLIATNYVRVYHPVKRGYETSHIAPATEAPINSKCVTLKELRAKILRSSAVTEINTTGLTVGEEVEGTVAGTIESGTTITAIKESEKKITLSKAAKPAAQEANGVKIVSGSAEVTNITPTGLEVGEEVEGTVSGTIESGTTITAIKESEKKITLSKTAKKSETSTKLKFYGETTKLKVYVATGYEYNSAMNTCHKVESGYSEYVEAENLYIKKCESESEYTSNGFCQYENSEKSCSSKATNLNASEDPNKWGSLENPVIDAAILSTAHSFIVDNYKCGKSMGKLTVWGAIAQNFRGTVGTSGGNTGYLKNYNYDSRLATNQPPNFINPTSAAWGITRETQPPTACTATAVAGCG